MAGPGFEKRLREFLASEDFEVTINSFLTKNAKYACAHLGANGEFSLESHDVWKDYFRYNRTKCFKVSRE